MNDIKCGISDAYGHTSRKSKFNTLLLEDNAKPVKVGVPFQWFSRRLQASWSVNVNLYKLLFYEMKTPPFEMKGVILWNESLNLNGSTGPICTGWRMSIRTKRYELDLWQVLSYDLSMLHVM